MAAMAVDLLAVKPEDRTAAWKRSAPLLERALTPVTLDGVGASVPPGIRGLLNQIIARMTRFNFVERATDLDAIRAQLWSAIQTLNKDAQLRKRAELRQIFRKNREENIRRRQERLAEYLRKSRDTQCLTPQSQLPARSLK